MAGQVGCGLFLTLRYPHDVSASGTSAGVVKKGVSLGQRRRGLKQSSKSKNMNMDSFLAE
jgi:hypothetical protein